MAANQKDPYFAARQQLQDNMSKTMLDFEKWKAILERENTATSPEFSNLGKTITIDLKAISVDLNNLQKVITVVENNRGVFKHIDDEDLNGRRKFVNDIKAKVLHIDEFMNSARTKKKLDSDKRRDVLAPAGGRGGSGIGGMAGRNVEQWGKSERQEVVERKRAEQDLREEEEKVVLDDMSSVLDRLKFVAHDTNRSLKDHSDMINNLNDSMDVSKNMMDNALRKMDVLLAKSKTGRLCCMFLLFIVVVVLFALIIYL